MSNSPEGTNRKSHGEAGGALRCFDCGAGVHTEVRDHTFTYGAGGSAVELSATVPVEVCASCGGASAGHVAEQLIHEAVCAHHGVLNPREVSALRKRHGLSRAAFAELTGLGEATLHRWENGIFLPNRANDRYLRLLQNEANIRALRRLSDGEDSEARPGAPNIASVESAPGKGAGRA